MIEVEKKYLQEKKKTDRMYEKRKRKRRKAAEKQEQRKKYRTNTMKAFRKGKLESI